MPKTPAQKSARASSPEDMPEDMRESLRRLRQITISVVGRKSGKWISIPVWFVLEGEKLYLLPVAGSATQWYRNVRNDSHIRIAARSQEATFGAQPITSAVQVSEVIAKFREKYGTGDVKKYYSGFDVAVLVPIS